MNALFFIYLIIYLFMIKRICLYCFTTACMQWYKNKFVVGFNPILNELFRRAGIDITSVNDQDAKFIYDYIDQHLGGIEAVRKAVASIKRPVPLAVLETTRIHAESANSGGSGDLRVSSRNAGQRPDPGSATSTPNMTRPPLSPVPSSRDGSHITLPPPAPVPLSPVQSGAPSPPPQPPSGASVLTAPSDLICSRHTMRRTDSDKNIGW